MDDLRPAFGQRLRALRGDLSQEEVAHRAAVPTPYLSGLERGKQTPTLDVINRLAHALGVSLAEMFQPFGGRFRRRIRPRGSAPKKKGVR